MGKFLTIKVSLIFVMKMDFSAIFLLHTPEQDGVVKRKYHSLQEMARTSSYGKQNSLLYLAKMLQLHFTLWIEFFLDHYFRKPSMSFTNLENQIFHIFVCLVASVLFLRMLMIVLASLTRNQMKGYSLVIP